MEKQYKQISLDYQTEIGKITLITTLWTTDNNYFQLESVVAIGPSFDIELPRSMARQTSRTILNKLCAMYKKSA